ncbi:uncharacterized protein [Dysidea avara]|uniref:uncharacterized protein n=1 Tax=Dysidea avara TaxID=196820 RepID=UPI003333E0E3
MDVLFSTTFCLLIITGGFAADMSLTLVRNAQDTGAVCLDGSPPGYYYRKGSTDPNKWIIHMEGGGYCNDEKDCVKRSFTDLGSSKKWSSTKELSGFLSDDCTENPHFCGWSVAFIPYCDGGIYSGNVLHPVKVDIIYTIYFRGIRILDTVIGALLTAGVNNAEHVILTGCSAGGLSTYLHVDRIRGLLPNNIPMHALADAGYFLDAPNVQGDYAIREAGQYVFKMQNVSGGLNQACVTAYSKTNEDWKCIFPQYSYQYIKSPIFSFNSAYDTWQLANILQLGCLPPKCSEEQMKQFENYGQEFKAAVSPVIQSPTNGAFIDSCVIHCQSLSTTSWTQFKVDNQTVGDTFYAWMTGNTAMYKSKVVDCAYPCNPTCSKTAISPDEVV